MEKDGTTCRTMGKSTNQMKTMLLSWLKVLQNVNDFHIETMPYKCVVGGFDHKSLVHKTLKFHSFPKNEKIKWKLISAVSLRTSCKWHVSHCVCSSHFHGRHMYGSTNIPAIFARRDLKMWPVDISHFLVKEAKISKNRRATKQCF